MGRRQLALVLLAVLIALAHGNRGYDHGRSKSRGRPGARSHVAAEATDKGDGGGGGGGGGEMNVCALEQKTTINLFCYCDESAAQTATSADCWVFNTGEQRDSAVWRAFRSQRNVTKLTFNVRGSSERTLSYVPTEALAQLPELRALEIVYAGIGTVHTHAFANLSRLQDLALGRNNIVRLARESIAHMRDARVVTLADNHIDGISNDVFAALPALRKLYMNNNNISYVAEGAFEQLRRLEELDLSENRLSGSLSRYVFLGLVQLRRLDMRANRLDRVGPDAFAELVCLEELVLDDNALRTVDGRGFAGLPVLQRLSLSGNRLTALDDRTFHRLDRLRYVDVRNNRLRALSYGTVEPLFDRLRNVTFYFHLEGNVFECDCGLLWMNRLAAETINDQVIRMLSETKCTMNDTIFGDEDGFGGGPMKTYENLVDSVPEVADDYKKQTANGAETSIAGPVDAGSSASTGSTGGGEGETDEFLRPLDESQLTKVSSLNEETCPGKEQPLVDGAPDAAQNSDRVLWESTKTSGGSVNFSRPPMSSLLLSALAFILCSRRC